MDHHLDEASSGDADSSPADPPSVVVVQQMLGLTEADLDAKSIFEDFSLADIDGALSVVLSRHGMEVWTRSTRAPAASRRMNVDIILETMMERGMRDRILAATDQVMSRIDGDYGCS